MFQFSPLVEHFLQSITKSQPTNANLPLLVLDSNAKTPNATDTPDLFKVLKPRRSLVVSYQNIVQNYGKTICRVFFSMKCWGYTVRLLSGRSGGLKIV